MSPVSRPFLLGQSAAARLLRKSGRPLRRLARLTGFDLVPVRPAGDPARRRHFIERMGCDLVVDVGANAGQYGQLVRAEGYTGEILSLEPMQAPYRKLNDLAARDPAWRTLPIGAGDSESRVTINIAGNSYSSSIMPMKSAHIDALPQSAYVGSEQIDIRRLDVVLPELGLHRRRAFLKIDTQGYEHRVLAGASGILECVHAMELEASLVPLYEGQMLFAGLLELAAQNGFYPVHVEPGFANEETLELLQVDVMFLRRP